MASRPTGRKRGRPQGSFTTSGNDTQLFSALHRGQARIYRYMQRSLQLRIKAQRLKAEREGDVDWKIPEDMRAELAEIDSFLAKASSGMAKIQETAKKHVEDMPTDRLEAQLRAEFIASIPTWNEDIWAIVETARTERLASAARKQGAQA